MAHAGPRRALRWIPLLLLAVPASAQLKPTALDGGPAVYVETALKERTPVASIINELTTTYRQGPDAAALLLSKASLEPAAVALGFREARRDVIEVGQALASAYSSGPELDAWLLKAGYQGGEVARLHREGLRLPREGSWKRLQGLVGRDPVVILQTLRKAGYETRPEIRTVRARDTSTGQEFTDGTVPAPALMSGFTDAPATTTLTLEGWGLGDPGVSVSIGGQPGQVQNVQVADDGSATVEVEFDAVPEGPLEVVVGAESVQMSVVRRFYRTLSQEDLELIFRGLHTPNSENVVFGGGEADLPVSLGTGDGTIRVTALIADEGDPNGASVSRLAWSSEQSFSFEVTRHWGHAGGYSGTAMLHYLRSIPAPTVPMASEGTLVGVQGRWQVMMRKGGSGLEATVVMGPHIPGFELSASLQPSATPDLAFFQTLFSAEWLIPMHENVASLIQDQLPSLLQSHLSVPPGAVLERILDGPGSDLRFEYILP
jgi:hypothetical protein